MNFLARVIVMFLKKYKMNIHDWSDSGRDNFMWFYNLYYTEYKNKNKKYKDLEIKKVDTQYFLKIDYSYKNINLDINDLSWFLTRNRYLLNKNINNSWSYYNFTYTFSTNEDKEKAYKIFKKYYNITSCS